MNYNSIKRNLGKIAHTVLVSLWTDPVIFISIFGPLAIGGSLKLARAEFVIFAKESPVLEILSAPAAAGIVDYTISFYTALLAWVILLFKIPQAVYMPYKKSGGGHTEVIDIITIIFFLSATILFGFGVYIFMLGGGATREVLETYVQGTSILGQIHFPLETRLLYIRCATIVVGWFMLYLVVLRKDLY